MKGRARQVVPRVISQYLVGRGRGGAQIRAEDLLGCISDAVYVTDASGRIELVNRAFEAHSGYRAEEAVGATPRILKSGLHPPDLYKALWDTILSGAVWRGELVNRNKSGALYSTELSIFPVRAGGGAIVRFLAIQRDITRHKQLLDDYTAKTSQEAATGQVLELMESSESTAEFLQKYLRQVIAIFSASRVALFAPAEATGGGIALAFEEVAAGLTPLSSAGLPYPLPALAEIVQHALDGGVPIHIDETSPETAALARELPGLGLTSGMAASIRPKTGQPWVLLVHATSVARRWSVQEMELLHRLDRLASMGIDHVSRKAAEHRRLVELEAVQARLALSEAKYRSIFENSVEGLYQTSLDGQLITGNRALWKMLGYDSLEDLQGIRIAETVYPDPAERERYVSKLLEEGAFRAEEIVLRRKDGSCITVQESARVVCDAAGRPLHFEGSLLDVTAKKEMEKRLFQAQKMESVAQLAGGIAHDFNNLLTGIMGYSSLLVGKAGPDHEFTPRLRQILNASERAAELTRKLLAFSRRALVHMTRIDMNSVVRDTLPVVERSVDASSIRIEHTLDPLVAEVNADAGQMRQVLLNLALNARDAMPQGGLLSIRTELVRLGEEFLRGRPWARVGAFVCLSVSDTGHGIDSEAMHHLFEPFYTTKHDVAARGLGLSMVYGIVKSHSGFIDVRSEPGKGSTFAIYLAAASAPTAPEPERARSRAKSRQLVLIIDDEDLVADFARATLESAGFNVLRASTGDEGVQMYRSHQADTGLVLLDLTMPGKSGREALHELLALDPECLILLSSGYSLDAGITELLKAGAAGFLQKPYRPQELVERIRALLSGDQ